jgi:hypothetical protein
VHKDLVPALSAHRLEQLRHEHVAALIAELGAAGRGVPTIRRMIGVLSSALSDAVRQRRLTHNVAAYAPLPAEVWHAKVGITADLYSHLTRESALAAADSLGNVLDAAAAVLASERTTRAATTVRPHAHDRDLLTRPARAISAGERP